MNTAWKCCAVVCVLLALQTAWADTEDVRFQGVDRKITLSTPIAKITDTIKLKNTGGKPLKQVELCYGEHIASRLSLSKVKLGKQELAVTKTATAPEGATCFAAAFPTPLEADAVETIEATAVATAVLKPNPAQISQGEPQLMEYFDNLYVVSPYFVSAQTIEVVTPTKDVRSFTGDKATQTSLGVTFGRFDMIEPWALGPMRVHFEHNKPFKQVTKLLREVEVSHWGNIYVDEQYEIANAGAAHKGQFSRLRYSYNVASKGNSFRELRARLPGSASSIYYRDLIGNVSTSNVRSGKRETAVDLELRYPLMGSWKVDFNLGYSLPLSKFVKRAGGLLQLRMLFGPPFDDVWVEEMVVRVVLPEGATAIKANLPFDAEQSWDKKYTYLDTVGRPVLVLTKRNVVYDHTVPFTVEYNFPTVAMLREPLLLIAVFAAFFAAVSVYNRLEFTISKDERWRQAQAKGKLAGAMQTLEALLADDSDMLSGVEGLLSGPADADKLAASKAQLEGRLKATDAKIKAALRALEDMDAKAAAAAKDAVDKGRAIEAKELKLVADRIDMLRKGALTADVVKRIAPGAKQVSEQRAEWEASLSTLFAAY